MLIFGRKIAVYAADRKISAAETNLAALQKQKSSLCFCECIIIFQERYMGGRKMQNIKTFKENSPRLSVRTRQVISAVGGAAAAFLFACLLHFIYDLSGGLSVAAILGAANESVWEHMKVLAVAFLMWSFAQAAIIKVNPHRLLVARTLGVIVVMLATMCFFYIYSGVLGKTVIWVDIASAFVWLLLGELVALRIINSPYDIDQYYFPALALLVLLTVALLCFTASPPKIGLFKDSSTGLYGLEKMP